MERIVEPELMDDEAQALAYAQAGFEDVNQRFVDEFLARFPDFTNGELVDLGCGPADIPIRLCRARPLHVTALDGAQAMLDLAEAAVREADLEAAIELSCTTLPAPLEREPFDGLISNSLLHHLHDPAVFWNAVRDWTRPGGPIWIVDLMRPRSVADARALVEAETKDAPEVLRTDFFNSLCAAFSIDEIRAQLEAAGLGLTVETYSDRHLAVSGTR